jgi:hypothetical protein
MGDDGNGHGGLSCARRREEYEAVMTDELRHRGCRLGMQDVAEAKVDVSRVGPIVAMILVVVHASGSPMSSDERLAVAHGLQDCESLLVEARLHDLGNDGDEATMGVAARKVDAGQTEQ